MNTIKVLVVDDSAFMRRLITSILSEDERIEVVGTARNGEDCLEKIKQLKPDVVTLDVEMPIMTGLEALQIIMKEMPLPVIMLSSTTKEGAENTLLAFQYGAYDFIPKPSGSNFLDLYKVKEELIQKIIEAKLVNISRLKTTLPQHGVKEVEDSSPLIQVKQKNKIVMIGTSTGGPRALQQVIPKLPKNFNAPVLIVQHMPPGFTKSLAERLNTISRIRVKEAENGEILQKGTAYIAPGGYHLKIRKVGKSLAAQVDQSPIVRGHRPSVDVLLQSASQLVDYEKIIAILTGMGSDGSIGLAQLKRTGNVFAIAESEETAVINGMPKAAISTGCIDEVVALPQIAERILNYVQRR